MKQKPTIKCLEGGVYFLAHEYEGGNVMVVSFPNDAERQKYIKVLDKDYLEIGNPITFKIEIEIPDMIPIINDITEVKEE